MPQVQGAREEGDAADGIFPDGHYLAHLVSWESAGRLNRGWHTTGQFDQFPITNLEIGQNNYINPKISLR